MSNIQEICQAVEAAVQLRIAPDHIPITDGDTGRSWDRSVQVLPGSIVDVSWYDDTSLGVHYEIVVQMVYTHDPGARYVELMRQAADDAASMTARVLCAHTPFPIEFLRGPEAHEVPGKPGVWVRETFFVTRIQAGA